MIAKYKGHYCNVDVLKKPIEIWVYQPIEGFVKGVTKRGTVYYEKTVSLKELDDVFEVGFSVCWDGQWCGIYYNADKELLSLHTSDRKFADNHGMTELERGAYSCAKPASCFSEYRLWTKKLNSKEDVFTMVSYDEFKTLWTEMISDLVPPRD